ncbi:hypothetical protein BDR04DRAFT_712419 [Suillus decipiens]|nr:hypothetical protein BDR04DRAFT_712419 [Suillus decipiens]
MKKKTGTPAVASTVIALLLTTYRRMGAYLRSHVVGIGYAPRVDFFKIKTKVCGNTGLLTWHCKTVARTWLQRKSVKPLARIDGLTSNRILVFLILAILLSSGGFLGAS